MIYTFDDCELDVRRFELRRGGVPVPLEPQVFEVISYLVENRDRIIPKQELLDHVWPERFVGEAALNSRVMAARKALGDNGKEQRLIKTVHGRGFRFVGEVTARDGATPAAEQPPPEPASGAVLNLPPQPNRFIGRTKEVHELVDLVTDPECRLVTVVGAGGAGKTRLSLEVARSVADRFSDGVHFVPLEAIDSPDLLVEAIAGALRFALRGPDEPGIQLVEHLKPMNALLLLDNFEHLVAGAGLVSDIVARAPHIKLLVTTREALSLSEEWVYSVAGMPVSEAEDDVASSDAVNLFVERARRVNRSYSPESEWHDVARVCRLVQGLPLGIELAATWVKVMPPSRIAEEIEKSVDFLATTMRNVPERHRTMRAVFDESWRLLSEEEREVFSRLSVMRGSFDLNAAEKIAGASLYTLSALVDKSLVRPLADEGRYRVHEILRQYAAMRLAESEENVQAAKDAHGAYYAGLLAAASQRFLAGGQMEAIAVVDREIDNIRVAWEWAAERRRAAEIQAAVHALAMYYQIRGHYSEAVDAFGKTARALQAEPLDREVASALALALTELGWFNLRLGRLEQVESAFTIARDILTQQRIAPVGIFAGDPEVGLGILATARGGYDEAVVHGQKSLQRATDDDDPYNLELAYYVLARAALLKGQHQEAHGYADKAYDTACRINDRWFMAYCLIERGNAAVALGNVDAARRDFLESYKLRDEFDDAEGKALALTHLGEIEFDHGSCDEAGRHFAEGISIYGRIQDKGGLAAAHRGMARVLMESGDYSAARDHLREAVRLSAEIRHVPFLLACITCAGDLLLRTDDTDRGAQLLRAALHHPISDHETQMHARHHLEAGKLASDPPPDAETAASILRSALDLPSDIGLRDALVSTSAAAATRPASADTPYPDDLSSREVEVLRLIALGKSNRDIADELYITVNTVANHVKNILSKTGAANRTEAAAYAKDKDLL